MASVNTAVIKGRGNKMTIYLLEGNHDVTVGSNFSSRLPPVSSRIEKYKGRSENLKHEALRRWKEKNCTHDTVRVGGPAIRTWALIEGQATLQCLNKLSNTFTTYDSFQSKPVVLRVDNTTSHISTFHSVIQERKAQKLGVKLWMVRWSVEYDIATTTNFVSAEEMKSFWDE